MRKPGTWAALLCALVFLAGLAAPVCAARDQYATLTVLVTQDGSPVSGALVWAADSDGEETIALTGADGLVTLAFKVTGRHTETVTFQAQSATSASRVETVDLQAGDQVLGTLILARGIPLQDISF